MDALAITFTLSIIQFVISAILAIFAAPITSKWLVRMMWIALMLYGATDAIEAWHLMK